MISKKNLSLDIQQNLFFIKLLPYNFFLKLNYGLSIEK